MQLVLVVWFLIGLIPAVVLGVALLIGAFESFGHIHRYHRVAGLIGSLVVLVCSVAMLAAALVLARLALNTL